MMGTLFYTSVALLVKRRENYPSPPPPKKKRIGVLRNGQNAQLTDYNIRVQSDNMYYLFFDGRSVITIEYLDAIP